MCVTMRGHVADALRAAGVRTAAARAGDEKIAAAECREGHCHQKRHKAPAGHHGESYGMSLSVTKTLLCVGVLLALPALAQEHHHHDMGSMEPDPVADFLMS